MRALREVATVQALGALGVDAKPHLDERMHPSWTERVLRYQFSFALLGFGLACAVAALLLPTETGDQLPSIRYLPPLSELYEGSSSLLGALDPTEPLLIADDTSFATRAGFGAGSYGRYDPFVPSSFGTWYSTDGIYQVAFTGYSIGSHHHNFYDYAAVVVEPSLDLTWMPLIGPAGAALSLLFSDQPTFLASAQRSTAASAPGSSDAVSLSSIATLLSVVATVGGLVHLVLTWKINFEKNAREREAHAVDMKKKDLEVTKLERDLAPSSPKGGTG